MKTIYFDNNATTFLDPVVANKIHELSLSGLANPASQHTLGRQSLHLLEAAKSNIIAAVGGEIASTRASQIILTSGGTEANNLAILGRYHQCPGTVIVGGTDHPSVLEAAKSLGQDHFRVLPVDQHGQCDLDLLQSWLDKSATDAPESVALISIMLGNNETGILQDLEAVCQIASRYEVPVHSDIVQAVGKIPCNFADLGLSAVTLTAHKIHGPVGIGALVTAADFTVAPIVIGGGQQLGIRAGTEPVMLACAFDTALQQILAAQEDGEFDRLRRLRDHFESSLIRDCEAVVIGYQAARLPHTSNLAFPGADRQALHMALDLNGIACSTGSACSSGSSRPAGSLVAMGLSDELVKGSLRFSFSRFTTDEEVQAATAIVTDVVHKCRLLA